MKKRWIACTITVLLLWNIQAMAAPLPLANMPDAQCRFEKYASYKIDSSGAWSAYDTNAAQLLRLLKGNATRQQLSAGVCAMYVSVRGNAQLGLVEPMLNVCLVKSTPLGADSISIVTGGVRYDFVAASERESIGAYPCERFELPLDALGVEVIQSIAANGCSVSIYGGTKFYRTQMLPTAEGMNAKQKLEALSIDVLSNDGFDGYALWDLNAFYWNTGRPQSAVVELAEQNGPTEWPALDGAFQCLMSADKQAVSRLQALLTANAFYAGKVDGKYGTDTRAAIREAQRFYGLLEAGQADRTLISLLTGSYQDERSTDAAEAIILEPGQRIVATPGVPYRAEGIAEVKLDRYWIARALLPSGFSASTIDAKSTPRPSTVPTPAPTVNPATLPRNGSNAFVVSDGRMTNLSVGTMFIPSTVEADLMFGDYTYPCTVRIEQSQGKALGVELLPMESARLIIYAEVPHEMSILTDISVAITVSVDGKLVQMIWE